MAIKTLAQHLAALCGARHTCAARVAANDPRDTHSQDWFQRHTDDIDYLARNYLPSGSGIDNGVQFDANASNANKLVMRTSFHHMNDSGMYDGWTGHKVTVWPAFEGLQIHVDGRNRNDIKDYLTELFDHMLSQPIEQTAEGWKHPARSVPAEVE